MLQVCNRICRGTFYFAWDRRIAYENSLLLYTFEWVVEVLNSLVFNNTPKELTGEYVIPRRVNL